MVDQNVNPTGWGRMDNAQWGAFAYILGWISGPMVLVLAGDNKSLKFHAWQSIIFSVILTIIFVVGLIICIGPIIAFIGWLYMCYGALLVYSGKPFRIPVIANFVEKTFTK